MTTIVYIDGFNLYSGVLRGSPHKWLDLERHVIPALGPTDLPGPPDRFYADAAYLLAGIPAASASRNSRE